MRSLCGCMSSRLHFLKIIGERLLVSGRREIAMQGLRYLQDNQPYFESSRKKSPEKAFAAWSLDGFIRTSSSSGGIYSVLGTYILEICGAISGCRFEVNRVLKHELCNRLKSGAPL